MVIQSSHSPYLSQKNALMAAKLRVFKYICICFESLLTVEMLDFPSDPSTFPVNIISFVSGLLSLPFPLTSFCVHSLRNNLLVCKNDDC